MDGIGERPPSPAAPELGAGCGAPWGAAGSGASSRHGLRMRRRRNGPRLVIIGGYIGTLSEH